MEVELRECCFLVAFNEKGDVTNVSKTKQLMGSTGNDKKRESG